MNGNCVQWPLLTQPLHFSSMLKNHGQLQIMNERRYEMYIELNIYPTMHPFSHHLNRSFKLTCVRTGCHKLSQGLGAGRVLLDLARVTRTASSMTVSTRGFAL